MRRAFVAALLVAGCASHAPPVFDRGPTPPDIFARESAACEMSGESSRTTGGLPGIFGAMSYEDSFNRVYDACMRSKGYTRKR